MANIIDYVKNSNKTFKEKPLNNIDSLVFSQLSYCHFEDLSCDLNDITIFELSEHKNFSSIFNKVLSDKKTKELFLAAANSRRYKNIQIKNYVNYIDEKRELQFSAVTFVIDDFIAYLAFRGTDLTLVGWKEDFNMSFTTPVPAQKKSVEYLESVALDSFTKIYLGGHSKGGNLAVYAAMNCKYESILNKIVNIYSHDGPGFRNEIFDSINYIKIKNKIIKTIPQSSIVGILMFHNEKYSIVSSDRFGFFQHDPFSWNVKNNDFIYKDSMDDRTLSINNSLNKWLENISYEKRAYFIDTVYDIISHTKAKTIEDLKSNWLSNAKSIISVQNNLDKETKQFINETLVSLISIMNKDFRQKTKNKLTSFFKRKD